MNAGNLAKISFVFASNAPKRKVIVIVHAAIFHAGYHLCPKNLVQHSISRATASITCIFIMFNWGDQLSATLRPVSMLYSQLNLSKTKKTVVRPYYRVQGQHAHFCIIHPFVYHSSSNIGGLSEKITLK